MQPWLTEPLAAAHRDDLRRSAPSRSSGSAPRRGHLVASAVGAARRQFGTLLIRAGGRVGGFEAAPLDLRRLG